MNDFEIGVVGLGVMGRNILLNIADRGFRPAGYDHTPSKLDLLRREAAERDIGLARSPAELAALLRRPRAILILVPAGPPVDQVLAGLRPNLDAGDVVADGGNSFFRDTDRRVKEHLEAGIHFMGVGISGGEFGARYGPSIMPGGSREGWSRLQRVFESIAARVGGQPCVAHLGPGSAGHYVKMVHNGIEYGLMQLIAEAYDLLRRGVGMDNDALQATFERWNKNELEGYLIEITADIFAQPDNSGPDRLIDKIRDRAAQKGTGMWTVQDAFELQLPIPSITTAVAARDLTRFEDERKALGAAFPEPAPTPAEWSDGIEQIERALYTAMMLTYTQGVALLAAASREHGYGYDLEAIARIWRGGCIIRSAFLEVMRTALKADPGLRHLLLDARIVRLFNEHQPALRETIRRAIELGIPVPGLMSALGYFDAMRSPRLPANLIQAQRDYFGAHTFERIDRPGMLHIQWNRR